jgi:hypothetical protein
MSQTENKRIVLKNVRLSFPSLFKKAVFDGKEGKYEATFLLKKGDPQIEILKKEIDRVANDYFKGKVPKGLKIALDDGDNKEYDGYEGCMSLKAGSNRRVTLIDRDKTPVVEEDEKFYAGCFVNASVDFWVQDNQWGKRVNCNLAGVQFYDHGEAFGAGAVDATDDFDDVDDF